MARFDFFAEQSVCGVCFSIRSSTPNIVINNDRGVMLMRSRCVRSGKPNDEKYQREDFYALLLWADPVACADSQCVCGYGR